jgi:hypothetical protein
MVMRNTVISAMSIVIIAMTPIETEEGKEIVAAVISETRRPQKREPNRESPLIALSFVLAFSAHIGAGTL